MGQAGMGDKYRTRMLSEDSFLPNALKLKFICQITLIFVFQQRFPRPQNF